MQPAFAVGQRIERRKLILLERQQCELALSLPKFLAHPRIIVEQCIVFEDQVLADDALQRRRLLEELSARASGLCGLLHRLLSLGLQALEREDELGKRIDQRQAHQKEAEQDEFQERTR